MKGRDGFTLLELMATIAIIGILLAMATLYFMRLNEQYQVESLTKELYSTLMRARNSAATSTTRWLVVANAGVGLVQYGPDANENGTIDAFEAVPPQVPARLQSARFAIQFNPIGIGAVANPIVFDRRGTLANRDGAGNILTITLNIPRAPIPGGYTANVDPVMDCIAIEATRINIGKMETVLGVPTCVQK